jgi:anhydro-N-acetylmuramic acid kinase
MDLHVIKNETIPYNSTWINTLKTAVDFSETELEELNHEYTSSCFHFYLVS